MEESARADTLAGVARVIQGLVAGVVASEVTEDMTFRGDLELDSLTMVEFVIHVERKFDVNIPDAVVGELRTVGDVVDYVLQWYTDR